MKYQILSCDYSAYLNSVILTVQAGNKTYLVNAPRMEVSERNSMIRYIQLDIHSQQTLPDWTGESWESATNEQDDI